MDGYGGWAGLLDQYHQCASILDEKEIIPPPEFLNPNSLPLGDFHTGLQSIRSCDFDVPSPSISGSPTLGSVHILDTPRSESSWSTVSSSSAKMSDPSHFLVFPMSDSLREQIKTTTPSSLDHTTRSKDFYSMTRSENDVPYESSQDWNSIGHESPRRSCSRSRPPKVPERRRAQERKFIAYTGVKARRPQSYLLGPGRAQRKAAIRRNMSERPKGVV